MQDIAANANIFTQNYIKKYEKGKYFHAIFYNDLICKQGHYRRCIASKVNIRKAAMKFRNHIDLFGKLSNFS